MLVVDLFLLLDPTAARDQAKIGQQVEFGLGEQRIRIRIQFPGRLQGEDALRMRRDLGAAGVD